MSRAVRLESIQFQWVNDSRVACRAVLKLCPRWLAVMKELVIVKLSVFVTRAALTHVAESTLLQFLPSREAMKVIKCVKAGDNCRNVIRLENGFNSSGYSVTNDGESHLTLWTADIH